MNTIENMPSHSRVWVYQSDRNLTNNEVNYIQESGSSFIEKWAAHGAKLSAAMEVVKNRFVILMVDEETAKASGCSIDSSVHFIKKIEADLKIDFFNRRKVVYLKDQNLYDVDFQNIDVNNPEIFNDNILIFNNLVKDKEDWKENWIQPITQSWVSELIS